jgi:hypothetical protein
MYFEPNTSTTVPSPDPFRDLDIPPQLEANLQRHREHLSRLVVTLRSAGIDEQQIEDSVSAIVDSYKTELIRTMKEMVR